MMTSPSPHPQLEAQKQQTLTFLIQTLQDLPDFNPQGQPMPLSGGLLNFVWRIKGTPGSKPQSLIAKWAAPSIATIPDVQLDPNRINLEAKILLEFGEDGHLTHLASNRVRPPKLIKLFSSRHLLLMEDVCDCPDLSKWIKSPHDKNDIKRMGALLGDFIGAMHRFTAQHPEFSVVFNNPQIQRTRLEFQYKNVGHYAKKAGLAQAEAIGVAAVAYGEGLQQPGHALIMGDLWLPSILVSGDRLRIIDWELAHYGRPSQDVGHFAAHCWMVQHRYPDSPERTNANHIFQSFLRAYRDTLGDSFDQVFGREGLRESAIHFGSEVLTRTVGNFQKGYIYEGLPPDHTLIQEAAEVAEAHILDPLEQTTFDDLNWREVGINK